MEALDPRRAMASVRPDGRKPNRWAKPWCVVLILGLLVGCSGDRDDRGGEAPTSGIDRSVAPRPNVVVILSDTHRLDHVSPFDGNRRLTPNLELLGRQGLSFERATSPVPISAPAYATLFTGRSPLDHGLVNNHQSLGPELPTLAEELRAAGYRTGAVVANPFCGAAYGFDRGFDHFWDAVDEHGKLGRSITNKALAWLDSDDGTQPFFLFAAYMDAHTPYVDEHTPPSLLALVDGAPCCLLQADDSHVTQEVPLTANPGTTRVTLRFLPPEAQDGAPLTSTDAPSPLYLVEPTLDAEALHFGTIEGLDDAAPGSSYRQLSSTTVFEVVNPTEAPVATTLEFRAYRRYGPDDTPERYADGVRAADRAIGALLGGLDERGLSDDTVVVFVADHGEMLGEHDAWGHVHHLWRPSLRIPLILKGPGIAEGETWSGDFGLADLHQLLLAWTLDTPPGPTTAGLLEGYALDLEVSEVSPRLAYTFPPEAESLKVSARWGDLELHLTDSGTPTLFDLAADPDQTTDRFAERRNQQTVRRLLVAARGALEQARDRDSLDLEALDDQERRQLEALGYLDP